MSTSLPLGLNAVIKQELCNDSSLTTSPTLKFKTESTSSIVYVTSE